MEEDELRRLLSETTPRPSRRLDVAAVRRRGRVRRARVLSAGGAAVLTVVALGATTFPPAGETVVFSPGIPEAETPEVAVLPTGEPEPTETAEETPSPMPEPDPEPTSEPELAHEPSPSPTTDPQPSPAPTPSVEPDVGPEPEVEPESDSEREARSHRNGEPLWGRRFVGVSVTENGQPKELVPGTEIRLSFAFRTDIEPHHGAIGWYGGCNRAGARVHVEPSHLLLDGGSSTLRGCSDAVEEQEYWLALFLYERPSWRIEGERLWLWSEDTVIEWVEDHRPPENR